MYNGKNVLVYGTGLSGISAVSFLLKHGANVFVYDDNNCKHLSGTVIVRDIEKCTELNIHLAVLSPGVQVIDNPTVKSLISQNIKIVGEFYLGFNNVQGKTVCITGTNGKTTTVSLIYSILSKHYKEVFLCGNTETPITQICDKTSQNSVTVCEVSSFALELCLNIQPAVSAILNISTDHLIRHKTMEQYTKEKLKITTSQTAEDYFICNSDFKVKTLANTVQLNLKKCTTGVCVRHGYICYNNKKVMPVKHIKLLGSKNLENVLCAVAVCKILNVPNNVIDLAIKEFKPLKNRLEPVYIGKGVKYVNDSKSTNPSSTVCALLAFKKPCILLLGGSDKGYDFDKIFKHRNKIKTIIAFGATKDIILNCANRHAFLNVYVKQDLKSATTLASQIAKSKDIVLLSPACASFDEFINYEQRGEMFALYVKELYGQN